MSDVKALSKAKTIAKGSDTLKDRLKGQGQGGTASAAATKVTVPFFGGTAREAFAWDILHILIPGVATCTFESTKIGFSGGPSVKWDVKPAPGTDGASETDQGYQPAQLSVDVLIWNRNLFLNYAQLLQVAKVKPGKTRSVPMQIFHPHLELFGLRTFVIVGTPLLKDAGAQMKTATFQILEYFAKPKQRVIEKNSSTEYANLKTVFDKPDHNSGKPATSRTHRPREKDTGP